MKADRPLAGKRVLVTRPAAQAAGLSRLLREAGAEPVQIPAFRLQAAADTPLAPVLAAAGTIDYDTVVFTSANAVRFFVQIAEAAGVSTSSLEAVRVAAVGPATAEALAAHSVATDCLAQPHTAEGMIETLRRETQELAGHRVLYPRAADARDVIETALTAYGAHVDAFITYGVVSETPENPAAVARLLEQRLDAVTFASPSAVLNIESTLAAAGAADRVPEAKHTATACIGPVTAKVARAQGYRVEMEAEPHTSAGLVNSIVTYFEQE